MNLLPKKVLSKCKSVVRKKYFFLNSVSVSDIWTLLVEKLLFYNIDQRAAAVAYNFTLAVFPTVLFLFTLIPYIPIANLDELIMKFLGGFMPPALYKFASNTIFDIVIRKQGGILSFGFLLALFTATNGMGALMTAFNMANRTTESRSYVRTRLVALWLTLVLSLVMILAIVGIIIGDFALGLLAKKMLANEDITIWLIGTLRYVVMFGTFWAGVSIIYRYAPNIKHGWRLFNLGSLIAALLIILATVVFSYYLSNFSTYNKLYGSIGTIIALVIWFYLIALMLIFGFELNISIWKAKHQRK
jgi:membrane protein